MNEPRKWLFEQLLRVSAVFIAAFAIYKYFDTVNREELSTRRSESLSYISEYYSDRMDASRQELLYFWKNNSKYFPFDKERGIPSGNYNKNVRRLINLSDNSEGILDSMHTIDGYFDRIFACRSMLVCDDVYLDQFACPLVIKYKTYYSVFFQYAGEQLNQSLGDSIPLYLAKCPGKYL